MFSFIKNDRTSFHNCSRVYEVYNYNASRYLRTALVVGFDSTLNKYYITMLGDTLLQRSYNLSYSDIGTHEFIVILNEFFNMLSLMSPEDFHNDAYSMEMPPLVKENFVLYVSDVEPYYDEDLDEHDGIWSVSDFHSTFLMDENMATPWYFENYDTDEYEEYDFDRVYDLFLDTVDIGLYCRIDHELLSTYAL